MKGIKHISLQCFSLKTLAWLLVLYVLLMPPQAVIQYVPVLSTLQQNSFNLASRLLPSTPLELEIDALVLSEDELQYFQQQPLANEELNQLLSNYVANKNNHALILLSSPLREHGLTIESMLLNSKEDSLIAQDMQRQLKTWQKLVDSEHIQWSLPDQQRQTFSLGMHMGNGDLGVSWLPSILQPTPFIAESLAAADPTASYMPMIDQYWPYSAGAFPLVWQNGRESYNNASNQTSSHRESGHRESASYHLDARLAVYLEWAKKGALQADDVSLPLKQTVTAGALSFPLSLDGALLPTLDQNFMPVRYLSLNEAQEQMHHLQSLLLVGDRQTVQTAATYIEALEHRAFAYTPIWYFWLHKAVVVLCFIMLLVLRARLTMASLVMAALLVSVLLWVCEIFWMLHYRQWLPVMEWLLIGWSLLLLLRLDDAKCRQLTYWQYQSHDANLLLAKHWLREARFDEAMQSLERCLQSGSRSDETLALAYDLAAQQERKRYFKEAQTTYRWILQRSSNFRDVKRRINALDHLSGQAGVSDVAVEPTQTLVLSDAQVNKPVIGRYQIERELGRGAMGIVYLARDPKITRLLAVKTLAFNQFSGERLQEVKTRFFREAEAAGRLSHPNIVTVFDVGEEHDLAYIAMDYIEGQALDQFCQSEQRLPVVRVLRLIKQVAEALDYAHGQQVVHRDIKPGNIIYNPTTEKVKVTDFGIARLTDESRTKTGDVLGSPLYMSPEQLKGHKVTHATDIYSLGVTLYQLLSGQLPFAGDNLASLTYNIIHKPHKPIRKQAPDLPASVTRLVNKALHKNPDKRYANAAEMADAIGKQLEILSA